MRLLAQGTTISLLRKGVDRVLVQCLPHVIPHREPPGSVKELPFTPLNRRDPKSLRHDCVVVESWFLVSACWHWEAGSLPCQVWVALGKFLNLSKAQFPVCKIKMIRGPPVVVRTTESNP
jgi:hypothetical protein